MSKKISFGNYKWKVISKFAEKLIKSYDKYSDKGYIFEVDVEHPKKLQELHNDLPFLADKTKIKNCC